MRSKLSISTSQLPCSRFPFFAAFRPCSFWKNPSFASFAPFAVKKRHEQSVVLIVVIGVLAVLSLLAATFAMIMRVEVAATRNQMEYQMAREAAHAGSEYLLKALAPYATGITSGPLDIDDICPNQPHSSAYGCQKLYERDGVMAYFAIEEHPVGQVWTQGLGVEAGIFNINGMGYEADLGSNANYNIRYTSFDTSLARLITARLATLTPAEIADVDSYRSGYPSIGTADEQERMGVLLARAIVRYRHGPDGVPGTADTEENRLGHLPRWSGTIRCSDTNAGVGYPGDTDNAYELGHGDGLPSYLLRYGLASYAEPDMWRTYDGATWQDDLGVCASGAFWGRIAVIAGAGPYTIEVDMTSSGWRNWPANRWDGAMLYVGTGGARGWYGTVTTTAVPNILQVSNLPLPAPPYPSSDPAVGDMLCLMPAGSVPFIGVGDLIPTGHYWPDGTLVTEKNVWDLIVYGDIQTCTGTVTTSGNNFVEDTTKSWTSDEFAGAVLHIYDGTGRGQVRLISTNTANTLTVIPNWTVTPDNTSRYRIEYADDFLPSKYQPDNLQGDDRIYTTLGILRDNVISPALLPEVNPPLDVGQANAVADILLPAFQKYLTVSARSLEVNQELGGINDWATDGVDNNGNGVVDDEAPSALFVAQRLYVSLGLKEWAHRYDDPTVIGHETITDDRIKKAAQLLANIIDFRDSDSVPTVLTDVDLDETAKVLLPFTVYGAEGLHVTEVMASPDPMFSGDGSEMTPDVGIGFGWDWNAAGYWEAMEPAVQATFTFNVPNGYYAMRLIGDGGPFTVTDNLGNPSSPVSFIHTDPDGSGNAYGFVRVFSSDPLVCFDASAGTLTFGVKSTAVGDRFYGFALLPQFIEITNIAQTDIPSGNLTVTTDQGNIIIDPAWGTPWAQFQGASADGRFPINYGTFVICMSLEAYERQWGNNSGEWGDVAGEDYVVCEVGDLDDAHANAMLIGASDGTIFRKPAVSITTMGGDLIAGGAVDGNLPQIDATLVSLYSSLEKNSILQPTWDATPVWTSFDDMTMVLVASQNAVVTVPADPPRDGGSIITSCLNKAYGAIWSGGTSAGYPALESGTNLAALNQVYPIILNRPYPTAGWLGLVPTSSDAWRTVDPDPTPADSPASPEELLGTLMVHATPGGIYARFNINSADEDALKAVFDNSQASALVGARTAAGDAWEKWDNLLMDSFFRDAAPTGMGFYDIAAGISNEDSGAGTFADDFKDDSDEREEWARRFSNLFDLRSTTFKFTVAGFVYTLDAAAGDAPVAEVRLELDVDLSDATAGPRVVHMRYLGQ